MRDDSLPALSFSLLGAIDEPHPAEVDALIELCDGMTTVQIIVSAERREPFNGPIDGSLRIDADGWDVQGTFHLAAPCTMSTDI